MSRPRLSVQHCVVNMTTRQYGPNPTSDLLGVDYFHTFPLDAEFPRTIGRLDLFVRFFPRHCGPIPILVRVYWVRPHGSGRQRVYENQFPVPFDPSARVLDRVFRLVNLNLPGRGTYVVRLFRSRQHRWRGVVWKRLASEWFEVG